MKVSCRRQGLAFILWLLTAAAAVAVDGVTLDPRHGSLKDKLQAHNSNLDMLAGHVLPGLLKLLDEANRKQGKQSIDASVLLIDIGDATISAAAFEVGAARRRHVAEGVTSVRTGIAQLVNWAGSRPDLVLQIGQGYLAIGKGHLLLGEKALASDALEGGLRFYDDFSADVPARLAFYPLLFTASADAARRNEFARTELELASKVTGPDGARYVSEANARLNAGSVLPLSIADMEKVRIAAAELATVGKRDAAYEALAELFAKLRTPEEKTWFTARLKPDMFLMFPDPNAARRIGWNDYQHLPLTAYDLVAARFFVDHDLKPYLLGFDDRSLYSYQDQVNIQLVFAGIIQDNQGHIDRNDLRYLCRIFPARYDSYENSSVDMAAGIPPFCVATFNWSGQFAAMNSVGNAVRTLEIGLDLLPQDRELNDMEISFRRRSLEALASLESKYGSPDTFLTIYEKLIQSGELASPAASLYKSIIEDSVEDFRAALVLGSASLNKDAVREWREVFLRKSPIAGPRISAEICANRPVDLSIIDQAAFCLASEKSDAIDLAKVRAELGSLPSDGPNFGVLLAPDWRLALLVAQPNLDAVRQTFNRSLAPGLIRFVDRALSAREKKFLERPQSFEEFEKSNDRMTYIYEDGDFDPAIVADALASRGAIELALNWARISEQKYRTADIPATILSAHLASEYEEQSYRDGWRWLMTGHPVLALSGFMGSIPRKEEFYRRGNREGMGSDHNASGSLNWEQGIGSYLGAMIASHLLGEDGRAREFAISFVAYLKSVQSVQSFSRNETQEIITRTARPALEFAVRRLVEQASPSRADIDAIFQVGQMLNAGGTGATVARLGARLGAISPELAELARIREEKRRIWVSLPSSATSERQAAASELDALDTRLKAEFPSYIALASVTALSLDDAARAMRDGEALLSYVETSDGYVGVALTREHAATISIDGKADSIEALVKSLRRGIQIRGGRLPNFRYADSYALYDKVVKPFEQMLGSLPENLLVVPDGALETIPFSILLTEPPGLERPENLKWLADRHNLSRLPSITSLSFLRGSATLPSGAEPFFGLGDPELDGNPADLRGFAPGEVLALRGGADATRLRALPRLPDTADELRQMQNTLGAPDNSVVLGKQATESRVRNAALDRYGIVAFATHGLVAGEIGGLMEPGLVMSPPDGPRSDSDDGYLAASEIAQLRLNADLVVLSACNTAAPGGEGAEGLSGLARSFFLAGARNLLVSNWAVDSNAASRLTTTMLKAYKADTSRSWPGALATAMRALRHDTGGEFVHPALWAPFEIVGAR